MKCNWESCDDKARLGMNGRYLCTFHYRMALGPVQDRLNRFWAKMGEVWQTR